jgi:hypothetical protein
LVFGAGEVTELAEEVFAEVDEEEDGAFGGALELVGANVVVE